MKVFIDTNIPMYNAGGEGHPNHGPARRFLDRVRDGKVEACTSTEVLQEILNRYFRLGQLDFMRQIYDLFVETCPDVLPITVADTDRARDLLFTTRGISSRDALHAAVMFNNQITRIATFDEGFDKIPGIERVPLT